MEIEYICEFVVLAETCNYMEAADRLFVSQSALSRHIKALEEELHVQLFDRSTRKVSLSPFGSLFLPYARQIASTRYAYEAAISGALKAEHGNIRIGSIPVMSQYRITDLIMRANSTSSTTTRTSSPPSCTRITHSPTGSSSASSSSRTSR